MSLINIAKIDFSPSEGGGGGDAKIQSSKTVKISLEGEQTFVTPDSGYDAMAVVTVNHDPVQAEKNITINQNGEVIITPDDGNAAMSKAKVIVDVPGAKEEVAGAAIIHDQGDYDFFPEEGKVFNKFHVYSAYIKQKPIQDKTVSITRNGLTVISPDEGWCLRDVTLDVNVPSTGTFVVPNGMKFAYWNGEPAGMSDWDYSALTDASFLFKSTYLNRSTIKNIVDHINWNNITDLNQIFNECYNLGGDASDILPETWVLGEYCTNLTSAFGNCAFAKIGNITVLNQGYISASSLFSSCRNLEEVGVLDFKPNDIAYSFSYCENLKKIGGIDLTNVTDTWGLFGYDWDENSQPRNLTDITFNGEINCNLTIPLPSLSVESIKSVLSAAGRTTTESDVSKTLAFNTIIVVDDVDERDRINTLIALCVYKGWTVTGLTILAVAPITVDNDNLSFSRFETTKQVRITHNGDEGYSFETSYLRDEWGNNNPFDGYFTWSTQPISENEDMLTLTQTSMYGSDLTGTFTVKDNATGYRVNIEISVVGDNISISGNPIYINWYDQGRAYIDNGSSHLVSIDLNTPSVEDPNERLYDYVTPIDEGTVFYVDPHYAREFIITYDKKSVTQNLTFNLELKDDNGIVRNILVVNLYAG